MVETGDFNKGRFVEIEKVQEGVECDIYEIEGTSEKDLGIIRIKPGFRTPRQRILKGDKTVEGFLGGKGKLVVERGDKIDTYAAGGNKFEVSLRVGDIMQWFADEEVGLIAYEVCYPPYEEGRYENLPDREEVVK